MIVQQTYEWVRAYFTHLAYLIKKLVVSIGISKVRPKEMSQSRSALCSNHSRDKVRTVRSTGGYTNEITSHTSLSIV